MSKEEKELQDEFRKLALIGLDKATDPKSKDFMVFDRDGQPLVDAAFLSHALIRAPKQLIDALDERVKENLIQPCDLPEKLFPDRIIGYSLLLWWRLLYIVWA